MAINNSCQIVAAAGSPADRRSPAAAPARSARTAAIRYNGAARSSGQVYNAVCIACHAAPGVGGAPALGDGDAWAARIAQGMETLIDHAVRGFSGSTGVMPRKGGRVDLSDEEIIGAVEYMVEQVAQ